MPFWICESSGECAYNGSRKAKGVDGGSACLMYRLKTHRGNVVPQRETQCLLEMVGVNKRGRSAGKHG